MGEDGVNRALTNDPTQRTGASTSRTVTAAFMHALGKFSTARWYALSHEQTAATRLAATASLDVSTASELLRQYLNETKWPLLLRKNLRRCQRPVPLRSSRATPTIHFSSLALAGLRFKNLTFPRAFGCSFEAPTIKERNSSKFASDAMFSLGSYSRQMSNATSLTKNPSI